jgi:hypothetical protein
MDLASFKLLFSPIGQEALVAAEQLQPSEIDYLRIFQNLKKQYPGELAQAALETAILRSEAERKFLQAGRMYFTREALEQASPHQVSEYRSERYRGFDLLVDLGCSIGSDTLSMSRLAHTFGVDIDPLRLAMAKANADSLGYSDQVAFILADLRNPLPLDGLEGCGLFFDPSRRAGSRRMRSVSEYMPPLGVILDWMKRFPALGVKISPAVNKSEVADFDAEVEFVSLGGELKEALLWFGPLKTTPRRATILPGPHSLTGEGQTKPLPLNEPCGYLYEPDGAVLRAGLVAKVGEQLGAYQLDPDIAYLTADQDISSPFARVWQIEDWFVFNVKRLRSYLRERNVGQITVKKRGSPLQPQELISMLRLQGVDQRVVFLTHLDGVPIIIVCYQPPIAD